MATSLSPYIGYAATAELAKEAKEIDRTRVQQMFDRMLDQANVVITPGSGFGDAGEGHCRMALVENENRLKQAVRQMGRVLG